jgi:Icc-related predicted phosphoesterase
VEATLVGEPERLWLVLGAERLAGPIRQHRPQLVVHGHAHHGSFEGDVDGVPVYNVAVHVMGREFWVFDLSGEGHADPVPYVDEPGSPFEPGSRASELGCQDRNS